MSERTLPSSAAPRGGARVAWLVSGLVVLVVAVVAWRGMANQGENSAPLAAPSSLGTAPPPETAALLREIERVDGVADARLPEQSVEQSVLQNAEQNARILVELETPLPGPVEAQAVADKALAVAEESGVRPQTVTFVAVMSGTDHKIAVTYEANAPGGYSGMGEDPVSDAVVLIRGAHPVGRVTSVSVTPQGGGVAVTDPAAFQPVADEARRLHLPVEEFVVRDQAVHWFPDHGQDATNEVPPDAGLALLAQVAAIKNVTTAYYVPDSSKNSGKPYLEVIIEDDPAPVAKLLDTVGYADQLGFPVTYKVWGIGETGETSLMGWVSGRTMDSAAEGGNRPDDGVPGIPGCTADAVQLELPWTDAATGDRFLGVQATNQSDAACVLGSRPELSFLSADGSVPEILMEPVGDLGEPVVLEPGDAASSMIEWGAGATAGGVALTTAVLITLPGDDEAERLPVTDTPGVVDGIDLLDGATARVSPWKWDVES